MGRWIDVLYIAPSLVRWRDFFTSQLSTFQSLLVFSLYARILVMQWFENNLLFTYGLILWCRGRCSWKKPCPRQSCKGFTPVAVASCHPRRSWQLANPPRADWCLNPMKLEMRMLLGCLVRWLWGTLQPGMSGSCRHWRPKEWLYRTFFIVHFRISLFLEHLNIIKKY